MPTRFKLRDGSASQHVERMRVALETGGHPHPPSSLRNTFHEDDLREAVTNPRVDLIVHHGRYHDIAGFLHVGSHRELGVIYANRESVVRDVSVSQLVGFLTGVHVNRSILPGDRFGPRLFCHGASVNVRVLGAALGLASFSIPSKARDIETFHSYEELADAACEMPGAIVAGLRGERALSAGLRVVSVNGFSPLTAVDRNVYPIQYEVHMYIRQTKNGNDLAQNQFVEEVRRRIVVDENVLAGLAARRERMETNALAA